MPNQHCSHLAVPEHFALNRVVGASLAGDVGEGNALPTSEVHGATFTGGLMTAWDFHAEKPELQRCTKKDK